MPRSKPTPPRVAERPRPGSWGDDELMTLDEAVALYWPNGPLTVASLRTAIRDGRLPVIVIARKFLVSPRAIRAMSEPCAIRRGANESEASDAVPTKIPDADSWVSFGRNRRRNTK